MLIFVSGRGKQQIAGAAKAKGDNLLFLHADTSLPKDFDIHALKCLDTPGNVAGSFGFSFDLLQDDEKYVHSHHLSCNFFKLNWIIRVWFCLGYVFACLFA